MTSKKQQKFAMAKVVLVGNSAVGKTNIMLRFTDQNYRMNHLSTIGVDFRVKTLKAQGINIKMQLWDTAGQQKFQNVTSVYYRKASAIIFVYSVSDRKSFDDVQRWMRAAQQIQKTQCRMIVGNKCDCRKQERDVTTEEGIKLAQRQNCKFIETSAKDGININQLFQQIADELTILESMNLKLQKQVNKKQKCAC